MGNGDSAYLNAKVRFLGNHLENTLDRKKSQDNLRNNHLLKNLEFSYGTIAAHAIINYVSKFLGKPRSEILSNYETFSKYVNQVYGEAEARKLLSRLPANT